MTRRPTTLLLLAVLLVTSSVEPGPARAADPEPEKSVVTASGRVLPPLPAELDQPSVHAEMLADEGSGVFSFEPGGPPAIVLDATGQPRLSSKLSADGSVATLSAPLSASGLPNGLRKEVFGFLPYWMLTDAALQDMNYHLVSTIAYFSLNLRGDGYLTKGDSSGWTGWNSAHMTGVIDRAHANGVKVVLTVTHMAWNGDYTRMTRLLTDTTRRNRAVRQIVKAVVARGADGVNLDFEPVPTSLRDEYVTFVRKLKTALSEAGPGDALTVCVMAGAATWATGYDVAGLTASGAADALFVMGYDYHWSGSSRAGGVAPVNSPYTIDVDGTMHDFLAETAGSKIIWGVPYYGRIWPTTSKTLNSRTLGYGSEAYTYNGHRIEAATFGRRWDDVGKVPWYRYRNSSGTWVQGYYDDPKSLAIKYDLVNARGLAGMGIWTLLMDRGRDELWKLLADKFVHDTAAPEGGIRLLPERVDAMAVKVRWRVVDHASGVDRYNLQFRPKGGEWVDWLRGTGRTSAWFSGELDTDYKFRVQAVDRKGNRQPWIRVPSRPSKVEAGAFAKVLIAELNVRSGPGTGYPIVDKRAGGEPVYVLEGPISANGYRWFRVQYGFGEWPSSDYARIGWMADGTDTTDYLAPAAAPSITRLDPFVREVSATPYLSPNGDGRMDGATVDFRLDGPATSVRLDIVDEDGDVIRSIDLGPRSAGDHSASWNGRRQDGTVAPEGGYLPRIVAVDGDGAHYGPAKGGASDLLSAFGMTVDLTRPRVAGRKPSNGDGLVATSREIRIEFDEPVFATHDANAFLVASDGSPIPASNDLRGNGMRLYLDPGQSLPVDAEVTVSVTSDVRDAAGNSLVAASWTFSTAPGTAYDPARPLVVAAGLRHGYRIGAGGRVEHVKTVELGSDEVASAGHRATLPNLPGRWLFADNGSLHGRWVRESRRIHVSGITERDRWEPSVEIVVRRGTHTAYRFDADGEVTAELTRSLDTSRQLLARQRRIVNGRPYLLITDGRWRRYLLPESSVAYRPGKVDTMKFDPMPTVAFDGGRVSGFRYASDGTRLSRRSVAVIAGTTAHADRWAVINGVPHFRLDDGPLAGRWVRERDVELAG